MKTEPLTLKSQIEIFARPATSDSTFLMNLSQKDRFGERIHHDGSAVCDKPGNSRLPLAQEEKKNGIADSFRIVSFLKSDFLTRL